MQLVPFWSLFICLCIEVFADDPCRFEGPKGIIDLTSLGRIDGKPAFFDLIPTTGSNYGI